MKSPFTLFLLTLFLISTKPCYSLAKLQCPDKEREALLHFKHNLKSNPSIYSKLSSWVGDNCCAWPHVYCNNITGNVIELDLNFNQFFDGVALDGKALYPLVSLKYLTYLDLSYINFCGSEIPKIIGSFKSLEYLDLSGTQFSGRIPDELGNLSSLQELHLGSSFNSLYAENLGWLSQLKSLCVLNLRYTNMSMVSSSSWLPVLNILAHLTELHLLDCELNSFPPLHLVNFTSLEFFGIAENSIHSRLPDWLWKLNNLKYLYLDANSFYGSWPASVTNLSSLEYFGISNNIFNGSIAESIGQLRSLELLDINNNAFTGTISEAHFSNMSNLDTLDMSSNLLVFKISDNWVPPFKLKELYLDFCQVGPQFPSWLKNQYFLRSLSLNNAGINGHIPNWFANFTGLGDLNLASNQISDKLSTFPNFTFTGSLDLSNNSFSGPIPSEFGHIIIWVEVLDLSNNNLNGRIPSSFCDIQSQVSIDLLNNKLSGELPDCWKINSSVKILRLSHNNLYGAIPMSVCNLSMLSSLQLNDNHLSGSIPSCLLNSTSLFELYLGHNNFTGNIPSWNENSQLERISLRFNSLVGTVPNLSHLMYIKILDLSHNNLLGHIPLGLANLSSMIFLTETPDVLMDQPYLYYEYDKEKLWTIAKGVELEFTSNSLAFWTLIDLSENNLTGHIPYDLMKLHKLIALNLSGNHLTGPIPTNIDGLKQLEALDLSRNKLSGVIPSNLKTLEFLEVLNLSYNNLSGEIPFGDQLQTLNNLSIYEGNPYLCGYPLNKSCINEGSFKHEMHNGNSEELIWFYVAMAPGFVVGFWLLCGILVLKREWRFAYFQAVDRVYYMFIKRM